MFKCDVRCLLFLHCLRSPFYTHIEVLSLGVYAIKLVEAIGFDSPIAINKGDKTIIAVVSMRYYWRCMKEKITQFYKTCVKYQSEPNLLPITSWPLASIMYHARAIT